MRADHYRAVRQVPNIWNEYRKTQKASNPSWRADLSSADLTGADLAFTDLTGADLSGAELRAADLTGADLTGADLTGAVLYGANLRDAVMYGANLSDTSLGNADLYDVILYDADLTGADLSGAILANADLTRANLSKSSLTAADLSDASLDNTFLSGANLSGANLSGANLTRANLTRADLTRAGLGGTLLTDVDVSPFCAARDLRHAGPSHLDARTVMRSFQHPRIKEFMAACGVPWIFVEYMVDCAKAETAEDLGALMQSTFISYGQPDDGFARRLYDSLTSRRITVFYFPETATWGARLSNELHAQLNSHDRVILICSQHSVNRPGVLNEIQETFDREAREGGADLLLPIALDDYLFDPNGLQSVDPDLAVRIRARIVADFRKATTDPTEYDKALNRLIDVLKKARP